jgi:hypothetical protein
MLRELVSCGCASDASVPSEREIRSRASRNYQNDNREMPTVNPISAVFGFNGGKRPSGQTVHRISLLSKVNTAQGVPMAKGPTLFNNLIRRFREHKFPGLSIAQAAEKIGLPATYLTKIENGDLRKPNDRYLGLLEKSYSKEKSEDHHPLFELQKIVDVLPADGGDDLTQLPSTMVLGSLTRFFQDAKPVVVFGRGYALDEGALLTPWAVSRVMYSSECLLPYLIRDTAALGLTPAERLQAFFTHNSQYQILDWNEADSLTQCHAVALFIPGFLLAFPIRGLKMWGVTANHRALADWELALTNAKLTANPNGHINSIITKMKKVKRA